jgi:hypothetical protein
VRKPLASFLGTWTGSDEEFESMSTGIREMWKRYNLELEGEPRSASTQTS